MLVSHHKQLSLDLLLPDGLSSTGPERETSATRARRKTGRSTECVLLAAGPARLAAAATTDCADLHCLCSGPALPLQSRVSRHPCCTLPAVLWMLWSARTGSSRCC